MRHAVPVDQHKNGGAPVHRVPGRASAVRRAAIQQLMPGPPMLAVMADDGLFRRGPHVARARFKITIRRLDAMWCSDAVSVTGCDARTRAPMEVPACAMASHSFSIVPENIVVACRSGRPECDPPARTP